MTMNRCEICNLPTEFLIGLGKEWACQLCYEAFCLYFGGYREPEIIPYRSHVQIDELSSAGLFEHGILYRYLNLPPDEKRGPIQVEIFD